MINDLQIVIITVIIGGTGLIVYYLGKLFRSDKVQIDNESSSSGDATTSAAGVKEEKKRTSSTSKGGTSTKSSRKLNDKPAKQPNFTHPWLCTSLKGHSGRILDLDFSENGKYLASTSEDRSVLIWFSKDFDKKEHKSWRGNIEYDHGTKVKWSPDCKAYVVLKAVQSQVEVYKITKKTDNPSAAPNISVAVSFDPIKTDSDIIGLGMSTTGKYIMTCSDKTNLIIWSLKGDILASLDTYHMNINYCAKISPCGRFVATSGFTPDVKVFEVKFTRTGEFVKVDKAFDLTGHKSGIYSFDFNGNSSRMATLSKDGTFRIFDTKIEYSQGQDSSCLAVGEFSGAIESSIIALSPDALVVAISVDRTLYFYSAAQPEIKLGTVENVHTETITSIIFDNEGKYIATSGDKHARIFHNVPGLEMKIKDLKLKLKTANTEAAKDRIQSQISEAEVHLKNILN